MGNAHRRSAWFHAAAFAGMAVAGPLGLGFGLGSASASEGAPDFAAPATDPIESTSSAPPDLDGIEFGLDAWTMMKQHRREFRRVPRMLPLLATQRTANGQLWFGLTRARRIRARQRRQARAVLDAADRAMNVAAAGRAACPHQPGT